MPTSRILPGVYSSINDVSALPEGGSGLLTGIVLQANKGTIGEAVPVSSISDLLTQYTFLGTVAPNADKSFFTATEILKQTTLYVSRAANNALFGGVIVKKEDNLGVINSIVTPNKIVVAGNIVSNVAVGETIRVNGTPALDGKFVVSAVSFDSINGVTDITVNTVFATSFTYSTGVQPTIFLSRQPVPFNLQLLSALQSIDIAENEFVFEGNVQAFFPIGDKVELRGSTSADGIYTIASNSYDDINLVTNVVVNEIIPTTAQTVFGNVFRNSIAVPENYEFQPEDLFIVVGVDQGAYNGLMSIALSSTVDTKLPEAGTAVLTVFNAETNAQLGSYTFARDMAALATDGTNIYVEDAVAGSAYVQIINNIAVDSSILPCSTISNVNTSGGYDGDTLQDADLIAALDIFSDKIIPISILANGSIESAEYQQEMINIAETRQDIFAFINSRLVDEKAATPSMRAANVVDYKINTLSSTSFYAAMYTPHVTIADIYNNRNVIVGADAKVVPQWLSVIAGQGYPFAAAGPRYGTVQGVQPTWKIGTQSGEASALNNASINYIGFDPVQGSYLLPTQNTLQIADSAMRDIGVVLNVLDIKQTLSNLLAQFLNLPITTNLRNQILFTGTNYMQNVQSSGRVNNFAFQDVSSSLDISNDTLRYVLTISPTTYAQKIYLVINIVNNTFDFSILQNPGQ